MYKDFLKFTISKVTLYNRRKLPQPSSFFRNVFECIYNINHFYFLCDDEGRATFYEIYGV